jgi:protein-S-isoprenylcysteine O-methyltransferase Ste14
MTSYFHGRIARPASPRWNVFKTLCQTVVFWTLFLVLIPWGILTLEVQLGIDNSRFNLPGQTTVGTILFALGGSLGLFSGYTMAARGLGTPLPADCPRLLVVSGPYRFLRNPMAVAGLSQGVAVGILFGSIPVIVYSLIGGPVWHIFVRPWEEADLEARFGEAYRQYRSRVRCWIPRWTRDPA